MTLLFLSTGTYTVDWNYGAMVKGVRQARFVTHDGKLIQRTIDGRQINHLQPNPAQE